MTVTTLAPASLDRTPPSRDAFARWLALSVIPWEPIVRRRLHRKGLVSPDIDDVVQEAYLRIASHEGVADVRNPGGYFLRVAANIVADDRRRSRTVRFEHLDEDHIADTRDDRPDPEQALSDRQREDRLHRAIDQLPARCRLIFRMRKIDTIPQREIGSILGITENTVETQVRRGAALVRQSMNAFL